MKKIFSERALILNNMDRDELLWLVDSYFIKKYYV